MTTHPMVPTNEQIRKWENAYFDHDENLDVLLIQVYQEGADQELEACCEWLRSAGHPPLTISVLHAGRRPKPPSLADEALETVQRISKNGYPCNYQDDADWDTIRRALQQLKQLQGKIK